MNAELEYILRVLGTVAKHDQHDDIWWHMSKNSTVVEFSVLCSDLFYWATADDEPVTPDNVGELERAYQDVKAAAPDDCTAICYGSNLFCCRMRKMRPQGCCYPRNKALWSLFDACGPKRETGHGNPYTPERWYEKKELERGRVK